jgi:hypothetical protein
VDVRDEMDHFMVAEVKFMEMLLHPLDFLKLMTVLLVFTPRLRELMLNTLKSQEEVKDLLVALHYILSEDCGKWR